MTSKIKKIEKTGFFFAFSGIFTVLQNKKIEEHIFARNSKIPILAQNSKIPNTFFLRAKRPHSPNVVFFLLCARMNNLLPPPQKQSTPIQGEKMSISRRSLALVGEVWPYSEKFGLSRRSLTLVGEVWPYPEKCKLKTNW